MHRARSRERDAPSMPRPARPERPARPRFRAIARLRAPADNRYHLRVTTFLFKTEPDSYSFQRLVAEKHALWDGITSNAALAHLRAARKGDDALIYHTGDEKAIVGLAQITSAPYTDPKNPGVTSTGAIKFPVVDLKPLKAAKTPVTLAQLKADKRFAAFALVRQPRLSVMPVPAELDQLIRKLAGL